jgi:hypothetical protein
MRPRRLLVVWGANVSSATMGRCAWVPLALAARKLEMDPRTVRAWIARRILRGKRVRSYRDGRSRWFVRRADLAEWLES